jgi:hypothetical protein
MPPKATRSLRDCRHQESAPRIDPASAGEAVITLATAADRQRLRSELLRAILKSESRRKPAKDSGPADDVQEPSPTEGSATLSIETAET